MFHLSFARARALAYARRANQTAAKENMVKRQLRLDTAAVREEHTSTTETVERLINYIALLEKEVHELRKQVAVAKGDLMDDEVNSAALLIAEFLKETYPDPDDCENYINSYMSGKYITEISKADGPGHAKAIAIAANMARPVRLGEST